MRQLILLLTFVFTTVSVSAQTPDEILGVWKNATGKGHIQIYKHRGKYYGKIVWLKDATDESGRPKADKKNEDPRLRSKPLIGLVMLRDFSYEDGEWKNGHIYNPSDGKEYKAYMKMRDHNTLDVRGYVGWSLFGKTDTWTRER